MIVGVLAHLAGQLARGLAWHGALRAAHPAGTPIRRRDVLRAWVAGAGVTGVVSVRGGDVVRMLALRPRLPGTSCATLAGTLAAETLAETACGAIVIGWALTAGVLPAAGDAGTPVVAATVVVALLVLAVLGRRWAPLRRLRADAWQGLSALREPRVYVTRVLPWDLLSRAVRLLSLACFMAAFGLPLSVGGVALVMAAQASGRMAGPAAAGVSVALLAASFGQVTGDHVSTERLVSFTVGSTGTLTVIGLALSAILAAQLLPAGTLRRLRAGSPPAAASLPPAGS
jgi:hypothetical protein